MVVGVWKRVSEHEEEEGAGLMLDEKRGREVREREGGGTCHDFPVNGDRGEVLVVVWRHGSMLHMNTGVYLIKVMVDCWWEEMIIVGEFPPQRMTLWTKH